MMIHAQMQGHMTPSMINSDGNFRNYFDREAPRPVFMTEKEAAVKRGGFLIL